MFHFKMLAMGFVAAAFMAPGMAQASEAKCEVKTNDIGTILGKGSSPSKAFEDAATQCFDRYAKIRKLKGREMDEEAGLTIIDVCANIKCG